MILFSLFFLLLIFLPVITMLLMKKKKKKLLFFVLFLSCVVFYFFYQISQPDILQPGQITEIEVRPKQEGLEPVTELYFDNNDGARLLLVGRDIWYEPKNELRFDIKNQKSVRWEYKNGKLEEIPLKNNSSKGITLAKNGIILNKKRKYIFYMNEDKKYKIKIINISDKPVHYTAIIQYR